MKESLVIVSLAFKKGYEDRPISDEEATITSPTFGTPM